MKIKFYLIVCLFTFLSLSSLAQWNISGTNIYNNNSGNVGIGNSFPQAKVVIRTSTATQGLNVTNCDAIGSQSHFGLTTGDQPRIGLVSESYLNIYNDGKWIINSDNTTGTTLPISIGTSGISRLFIKSDGNVGIGTTTPDQKLTVNGKIKCEELQVVVDVADYVFEDNYELKTLSEVEQYIKANKHLPGGARQKRSRCQWLRGGAND